MRVLNPLGILSSDVATGNLLWVDQVNGNDSLASRWRMTVPYQTLGAAKAAAQSGDTIMVLPGNYNERNLLRDGVNWYFLPGAKVTYSGGASGGMFDTAGAAINSFIAGHGEFVMNASSGTSYVLNCDNGSSSLSFEARLVTSQNATIRVTAGSCQIRVCEDLTCVSSDVVLTTGGNVSLSARDLISSGGCCLRVQSGSGTVDIIGRTLVSSVDSGVSIEGGSGAATVRAYEIRSAASLKYPLFYSNTGGGIVTILGARLKNGLSANVSYAVYISSASNDKVKLANCVLIAGPTATASMSALSAGTRVHVLGGAAANVAFNSTYITPVGAPTGGAPAIDGTIS